MRYNKHQTLAIILALVASMVVSHLVFAEEDLTAIDEKATARLAPTIASLQKKWPLEDEVEVVVISNDTQAWTQFGKRPDRIYIKDCGTKENIKALKHEWRHRFDHQNLIPMSESEQNARKAEDEKL